MQISFLLKLVEVEGLNKSCHHAPKTAFNFILFKWRAIYLQGKDCIIQNRSVQSNKNDFNKTLLSLDGADGSRTIRRSVSRKVIRLIAFSIKDCKPVLPAEVKPFTYLVSLLCENTVMTLVFEVENRRSLLFFPKQPFNDRCI